VGTAGLPQARGLAVAGHHLLAVPAHPVAIRCMHWVWVYAIGCMVFSGWQIYTASPSLPLAFPRWTRLGGWLGGALAWHFSAMWVVGIDGAAYLAYGFLSGHFRRDFGIPGPAAVWRDFWAALTFRLGHRLGHYNAVQRLLYIGVIFALVLQVATGVAIWKPVQLAPLVNLFGGYPLARNIHLANMFVIVAFVIIHVTLALIFPRTIVSMVVGLPVESERES
jgi:thiosulfate reductase cytochrome b subunit